MREILFRGKRFDTKEWIYGSLLEDDIIAAKGATDVDEDYIGFSDEWSSVDKETVGQFTGLTDKNGKRIFEGDRLKGIDILHCRWDEYTVIWETNGFYYLADRNNDCSYYPENVNDVEVIGNIHDKEEKAVSN